VPVSSGALARAVFVLLVLATVAAFFVTQRLKSGQPVVKRLALQRYFSPNGDGRKDRARISFFLPKGDLVTVDVVDAEGDRVRRLVDGRSLRRGRHVYNWDGRADDGTVPPDGTYYVRVTLRRQGRAATGVRGIELVTEPPHPRLIAVTPSWLPARSAGPVTIRYTGPSAVPPVYGIWRKGPGPAKRLATLVGDRQTHSIRWDAQVGGRPAPAGEYAVSVTVQNRALIAGSAPRRLPPTATGSAPHTGLTIGGPTLGAPLEPVRAGAITTVAVYGGAAGVRWRLARLGAAHPVARGHADSMVPAGSPAAVAAGAGPRRAFALRVPGKARTGLYVLTVAAGGKAVRTPLVVRGRGGGAVLVVIPTLDWQAVNALDDDGNGFPDTLYAARSVPLARPFAGGVLPPGLTAQVGPLLRFLDRSGIRYDVTTDLALALGRGPRLAGHRGVALAGDEPWLTPALAAELTAYVHAGGHVASFGGDSLRRRVSLTNTALSAPTAPSAQNVLGESTVPARGPQASLAASVDDLGLFAGTGGVVGPFTVFDESVRLPAGTRALSAAARGHGRSELVAYRLGRGLVIRLGTPQWAAALGTSAAVGEVTKRTWALLSH